MKGEGPPRPAARKILQASAFPTALPAEAQPGFGLSNSTPPLQLPRPPRSLWCTQLCMGGRGCIFRDGGHAEHICDAHWCICRMQDAEAESRVPAAAAADAAQAPGADADPEDGDPRPSKRRRISTPVDWGDAADTLNSICSTCSRANAKAPTR